MFKKRELYNMMQKIVIFICITCVSIVHEFDKFPFKVIINEVRFPNAIVFFNPATCRLSVSNHVAQSGSKIEFSVVSASNGLFYCPSEQGDTRLRSITLSNENQLILYAINRQTLCVSTSVNDLL